MPKETRTRWHIALLYGLFALIATSANLMSQWVVLNPLGGASLSGGTGLFVALIVGTGAGLVVKYILDKTWIFQDTSHGAATHARKFSLYSLMGLFTTLIFWGFEMLGNWLRPDSAGLYIGGGIGLMIGYVIKYHLDKRYVFDLPSSSGRISDA